MLLIDCPHCGPRAQIEFAYGGDAHGERPPEPAAVALEDWCDWIYLRENPRGAHLEWWQHVAGCRRWLRVLRDTGTHRILGSADAAAPPPRSPA